MVAKYSFSMAPKRMNVLIYSGKAIIRITLVQSLILKQELGALLMQYVTVSTHSADYYPPIMQSSPSMEMRFSRNLGRLPVPCS